MITTRKIATGRRVLFVDDEFEMRNLVEAYLQDMGAEVTLASDGKVAQSVVGLKELDLVISDVAMPTGNGIELLHFVRRQKPSLPVILTANAGEVNGLSEVLEMGAQGFIPKPFTQRELEVTLTETLGWTEEKVEARRVESDEDFCKLSIEDFTCGRNLQFDIFLRLARGKFIKLGHADEEIPVDQIRRLKGKNVNFLYLRRSDFLRYLGFNTELASKLKDANDISREKKVNFLKHTNEVILEQFFLNELDEATFDLAKNAVETTVGMFLEMPDLGPLLTALNNHSDHLYAHSVGVSFYASMIAQAMDWDNPRTLYKVSMGGLLHDLGKKEFDKDLLAKSRADMSASEVKMFQSHPTRGVEILSGVRTVPGDVLQIVLHHHENCIGTGWPAGLKKNYIHPLARVVAVADEFCHLILKSPRAEPLPLQDALEKLCAIRRQEFDSRALDALRKIFKAESADSKKSGS